MMIEAVRSILLKFLYTLETIAMLSSFYLMAMGLKDVLDKSHPVFHPEETGFGVILFLFAFSVHKLILKIKPKS